MNKKVFMFHQHIESALLEFVEHGDKTKLLDRLKFYSDMEELYIKYNEKYFMQILETKIDTINFEISVNYFL